MRGSSMVCCCGGRGLTQLSQTGTKIPTRPSHRNTPARVCTRMTSSSVVILNLVAWAFANKGLTGE